MRTKATELKSGVLGLFLLAALLAAAWLGLNFLFRDLGPTGIPIGVTQILINGTILIGLWRGLSRTDFTAGTRAAVWLAIAVPFTLWAALVWARAVNGAFRPTPRAVPLLPVAIFAPVLVGLILLTRSKRIASLLDATPPSWLIGLQLYRVLGGMFLVDWAAGVLPGIFAWPAGVGDITVGLLALPVALLVSSGTPAGRKMGILWNGLGLADFAVATFTGILVSLGPLQGFALNRPNPQLGTFPTVMVPAFAVPSSIILHALSLWQLRRLGRMAANTCATGQAESMASSA